MICNKQHTHIHTHWINCRWGMDRFLFSVYLFVTVDTVMILMEYILDFTCHCLIIVFLDDLYTCRIKKRRIFSYIILVNDHDDDDDDVDDCYVVDRYIGCRSFELCLKCVNLITNRIVFFRFFFRYCCWWHFYSLFPSLFFLVNISNAKRNGQIFERNIGI